MTITIEQIREFRMIIDGQSFSLNEVEATQICTDLGGQLAARGTLRAKIVQETCKQFNVKYDQVMSRNRFEHVAWARQVAMYLFHVMTQDSSTSIGLFFSRYHGTILYAIKHVKDRMATEPTIATVEVQQIRERVERGMDK